MKNIILFLCLISPFANKEEKPIDKTTLPEVEVLCSGRVIFPGLTYECIDSLELAGKCYGYANCTACTTCNYCKYCNSGGSCGVCAPSSSNWYKSKPKKKTKANSNTYKKPKPNISTTTSNPLASFSFSKTNTKSYYLKASDVSLRKFPSTLSASIKKIDDSTPIKILAKSEFKQYIRKYGTYYWLRVQVGNSYGWIYEPLINIDAIEVFDYEFIDFPKSKVHYDDVNVRSTPSTDGKVLFKLNKGAEIIIIKKSYNSETLGTLGTHYWFLINSEGKEGWIFGGLI